MAEKADAYPNMNRPTTHYRDKLLLYYGLPWLKVLKYAREHARGLVQSGVV